MNVGGVMVFGVGDLVLDWVLNVFGGIFFVIGGGVLIVFRGFWIVSYF